ncbi:unnamed protein product [Paramecium sonneborni]|uniref:Uncharacterized protein n=1 Tax=Paramecium sonneborni TaxID=65129 RepID=A0A8S1RT05_9CILI|nr:unnamed protein product [Paramecium sonneborni]
MKSKLKAKEEIEEYKQMLIESKQMCESRKFGGKNARAR